VERPITVAVVEDHEILRNGLVASLVADQTLTVTTAEVGAPIGDDITVVVGSSQAAQRARFSCPVVVCSDDHETAESLGAINEIAGILSQETLTAAQLRATVHAAATGLRINEQHANGSPDVLQERDRRILEYMADGYSTREIAAQLSYSERTIKKVITGLQERLAARTRAQIVALAIRRGLI
jgi:DNA-binding NarL/FixJ family response regulator